MPLHRRSLMLILATCLNAGSALAQMTPEHPQVKLQTTLGDIVVELETAKAPITVKNFLQYVNDKHYDGTIFHRVIDGFMIQGGGMTPNLQEKPARAPIQLEASNGLKNERGTIAMARRADPNSATAQFFINVADNEMLNAPKPDGHGYAVFGKVIQGIDVVDKIRTVATGNHGMHKNVPTTPILIQSATEIGESPLLAENKNNDKKTNKSAAKSDSDKSEQEIPPLSSMADGFEFRVEGDPPVIIATGGPCISVGIREMRFSTGEAFAYLQGKHRQEWYFTVYGKSRVDSSDMMVNISHSSDWHSIVAYQRNQLAGTPPGKNKQVVQESLEWAECLARSHMKYVEAQDNWMGGNMKLLLKLNPTLKPYLKNSPQN